MIPRVTIPPAVGVVRDLAEYIAWAIADESASRVSVTK